MTGKGFIDGVVDDLVHQVMQSSGARRPDIHAGTLPDRVKALENLNVSGSVFAL
jgi:hypothetical protein